MEPITRTAVAVLFCAGAKPEERRNEIMKIVFNDASELTVQKVYVDSAGALRIKTISATQEQLRTIFSDAVKTKKITVVEQGQTIGEPYEGYTQFEGIMAYTGGILEQVLYKAGETLEEILTALQADNAQMKETVEMLTNCLLKMSETVYA